MMRTPAVGDIKALQSKDPQSTPGEVTASRRAHGPDADHDDIIGAQRARE